MTRPRKRKRHIHITITITITRKITSNERKRERYIENERAIHRDIYGEGGRAIEHTRERERAIY